MVGSRKLRIGIAGCGRAGRLHLDRLLALAEAEVVGCADPDRGCAESLAERIGPTPSGEKTPVFSDYRELIGALSPDALCIFTPHFWHYRLAMDALQAGCHVLIEKSLSTNVQEAADIVGLAQGRQLKVGVGHQYRLCPSLQEARRLLKARAMGKTHLITALMARPWVDASERSVKDWRFDPRLSGGGVLTDAGDHLIDALLWTTGQTAEAVYAVQTKHTSRPDLVTAASLCLRDRTPATLGGLRRLLGIRLRASLLGRAGSDACHPPRAGNPRRSRLRTGPTRRRIRARNHRWEFRVRNRPRNSALLPCRGGARDGPAT